MFFGAHDIRRLALQRSAALSMDRLIAKDFVLAI